MDFLINKLNKHHVDPDGVEVYTNLVGEQTIHIDARAGSATIRVGDREVALIRNAEGRWVPAHNDWVALAQVLGAPGLARAAFGF